MTANVLTYLQLFLAAGNAVIMLYALKTFLCKPHDSLVGKVNAHEVEINDIKKSLMHGNDKFRQQEDTNEVMIRSLLALIEFEIQFLLQEDKPISKDLEKAKDELHNFLSKR